MPTIAKTIEQRKDGIVELLGGGGSRLIANYNGYIALGNGLALMNGLLRFNSIQIPQGATIISAYLTVYTASYSGTPASLTITVSGEKNGNPAPYTGDFGDISTNVSSRPRTEHSVSWTGFQTPASDNYPKETTPDLKGIFQEIVDRPDWSAGNAMHLILDAYDPPNGIYIVTYNYSQVNAFSRNPVLEIDFEFKGKKKRFLHKIYSGSTYVATVPDDIVLSKPEFSWGINAGMGEMNIRLGLTTNEFQQDYEGASIALGNRIKTYVQGNDEKETTQIYDGILTGYSPVLLPDGNEYINVRVASQVTSLKDTMLDDGTTNTTVTYSSTDPSTMLTSLIDDYAGTITYTPTSIVLTGTTATYTFQFMSFLDGVEVCLKLAPAYWYWYVDATSTLYFKESNFDIINHKLVVGRHINGVEATKSISDLKNVVYFKGGGDPPLYRVYSRTTSITTYGERAERMSDERVTVAATAETIATKFLDERDHPLTSVQIEIMDNSVDPESGYNLESLKPGDTVQVIDPKYETKATLWDVALWDVDFWDYDIRYSLGLPMQIQKIDYKYDRATLHLVHEPEDVTKRIEDINRNLDNTRSENIPTAPT